MLALLRSPIPTGGGRRQCAPTSCFPQWNPLTPTLDVEKYRPVAKRQRGRPLKFGRPARLLPLTLPYDVVRSLQRIHPDPAWAVVSLSEKLRSTNRAVHRGSRPSVELAQLSARSALIVVDPRTVRSVPGVSVVPVAAGRAFLAFDEGRGLADLELAVLERLQSPKTSATVRRELSLLQRQIRSWRNSRRFRLSTRSIILVEQVSRPPRGRPRTRPS